MTAPQKAISGSRDGVALVTVLAFIVLLTIMVISFISFSRFNRLSTNSYSRQIQAQEIALGGVQDIIGDLNSEMVAGSTTNTVHGVTVYTPTTNLTAVPARIGYAATAYGTDTTSSTLPPTVVQVSRATGNPNAPGGDSFFTTQLVSGPYTNNIAAGTILNRASLVQSGTLTGTAVPSVDGRYISPARWNKTCLLASPGDPTLIPQPFTNAPPDWVYVTRTGSRACQASEMASLKYSNNVTQSYSAPTPGNPPPASPVVGRYAYVVYDEGALLDANVAGSPSTAIASSGSWTSPATPTYSATQPPPAYTNTTTGVTLTFPGKSYTTFADLSALPGMTQPAVDNFVNWRNAGGIAKETSGNSSPFLAAVFNYAQDGFLSFLSYNGSSDSPLLSRQDLINYFGYLDPSGTGASRALPYLGTFSRAVNAPSWTPPINSSQDPNYIAGLSSSAPINYKNNAENSRVANRDLANIRWPNPVLIKHYLDDATSFSYNVNTGDPFLQARFSLAKINWLSQPDPVSGNFNTSSTYAGPIQACFGLVWGHPGSTSTNTTTSSSTANGGNPCWNYIGSKDINGTTHFAGHIETLDQVAAEGREPNFFEMLKAAILSGSLGLNGGPAGFYNGSFQAMPPWPTQGAWPYDFNRGFFNGDYNVLVGPSGLFSYTMGTNSTVAGPERVPDMQIMQIGANIIDQFDTDNYPTAIYFPYSFSGPDISMTNSGRTDIGVWENPSSDPVAGSANAIFGPVSMVYGVENLPLLHRIAATAASPTRATSSTPPDPTDKDVHTMEGWLQPQLWNPHQQPSSLPTTASGPVNFEIRAYGSSSTFAYEAFYGQTTATSLLDPANPPAGWNPPNAPGWWGASVSPFETYYPGNSSSENPSQTSSGGGPQAGTLAFTIASGQPAFYDTPRLLSFSVPNVTINTSIGSTPIGLPNNTMTGANLSQNETSYADKNFPGYNTPQSNGNSSYSSFLNQFAAFSTGLIRNQANPNPNFAYYPFYVGRTDSNGDGSTRVGMQFIAAGSTGTPGASFALGWYPPGHPEQFHPYSFITGIFETGGYYQMPNNAINMVGYVQTNNVMANMDWGSLDPRTTRFSNTFYSGEYIAGMTDIGLSGNNTFLSQNNGGTNLRQHGVPANGTFITPRYGDGTVYGDSGNVNTIQNWTSNTVIPPTNAVTNTSTHHYPTTPNPPAFNGTQNTSNSAYYADLDGVVRPADGLYADGSTGDGYMTFTTPGNPNATTSGVAASTTDTGDTQHGRRPVILNRPFRSVGELGYVFRDEPFKTLDMFSQSSADAALLDVFSVTDEARPSATALDLDTVISGQVDVSNAPVPVLEALLSVGAKKDIDPNYYMPGNADATKIANAIAAQLNLNTGTGPLLNRANLVTSLGSAIHTAFLNGQTNPPPEAGNKAYLEAPVRALSDVTNTRTWNLLIDIIAQSGQMSSTATSLDQFVVQGERRYWLHLSIDRYTGKVVAQQLEPVYE